MTTASAVAFAPAVVQEPPQLPNISASVMAPAIELAASVDPTDLIDTLQGAVNDALAAISDLAMLPSQVFVDSATQTQTSVYELYNTLISATSNPDLQALLGGMQGVQNANLGYLVNTADNLQTVTDYWLNDSDYGVATNVGYALNDAIYYLLTAGAGVINDPLALQSWTSLLSSVVYSALYGAGDLTWAAYGAAVGFPLDLLDGAYAGGLSPSYSGFAQLAAASMANWNTLTAGVLTGLASQTGSTIVENLTKALLAVTTTPASILGEGFADASYWTPVWTAILGPWNAAWAAANIVGSAFYNAGDGIGGAIDAIGADPLDPAGYVTALQGLVTAGFDTGNAAIWSANNIAQSAPGVFNSVAFGGEIGVNALVNAVGNSVSELLAAAGASSDVVQAPIDLADSITAAISNATTAATDASDSVANWLDDTAQQLVDTNTAIGDQINSWLGGLVGGSTVSMASTSARTVTLNVDSAAAGTGTDENSAAPESDTTEENSAARQTVATDEQSSDGQAGDSTAADDAVTATSLRTRLAEQASDSATDASEDTTQSTGRGASKAAPSSHSSSHTAKAASSGSGRAKAAVGGSKRARAGASASK